MMSVYKKYLLVAAASVGLLTGTAFAEISDAESVPAESSSAPAWTRRGVPADIERNYLAPETSVGEAEDAWRPLFREKFLPLVKDCRTATEAAEKLNREIWDILGVRYSPLRDKPDQSPFHSMRIGKASCTGLSILLINACRSVGVPARFVGCRWKNKPGNHSWVEIWDDGEWKFLGAEVGGRANEAWFEADAANADPADPRFAIYAACVDETGLTFPFVWNSDSAVPAINVTARYLNSDKKLSPDRGRISFELRSCDGARLVREIVFLDAETGAELARGATRGNGFDLNDRLNFTFPLGKKIKIVPSENPEFAFAELCVPAGEKILSVVAEE